MKVAPLATFFLALASLWLPACHMQKEKESHHEQHGIVVTSPQTKDVTISQPYVCLINSQRHIEVCAMESGRLESIPVKEGQAVKQGELMFKILPALYQARLDAEKAEMDLAQLELNNTRRLFEDKVVQVVSRNEVALYEAKLAKAKAKLAQAETELKFTEVRAAFDGIVDRQERQLGSVVKEGEVLTSLSDNSVMWVRFNVPEKQYFEYMALWGKNKKGSQIELTGAKIELKLADGTIFNQSPGQLITVEGKFDRETGNISLRADFPNPDGLLRHGQTGTILIRRIHPNAMVIPQRAVFEILDKQYVWVVGEDNVVHQREIAIENEMDDLFIIKKGLDVKDRIILEGVRQVHEGQKVEHPEFHKPQEVIVNLKNHAE